MPFPPGPPWLFVADSRADAPEPTPQEVPPIGMPRCRAVLRATVCLAAVALLTVLPTEVGAELGLSFEEGYDAPARRHTPFDARAEPIALDEGRFLTDLFTVSDEVVGPKSRALTWFISEGREGLHVTAFLEEVEVVLQRLEALPAPERLAGTRRLVAEAIRLQRGFFGEWGDALEARRLFDSQLTSEFGYHEGLHRSHRKLLQAYTELSALFPGASENARRAFHDHLRALDLQR